jgi:light-regulated signal transduction histidine kinase (bacteriophytochrome)
MLLNQMIVDRHGANVLKSTGPTLCPSGANVVLRAGRVKQPDGEARDLEARSAGLVRRARPQCQAIPPRYQPQVFGLFARFDSEGGGKGIGLAPAKRIIEAQWPDLARLRGEGQGCTFSFTLPAAPLPVQ